MVKVTFPENCFTGIVRVRPTTAPVKSNWQVLGNAQGEMEIPEQVDVSLRITRLLNKNLAWFQTFPADLFQELELFNLGLNDDDLSHFQHLHSLKALVLTANPVTGTGLKYLVKNKQLQRLLVDRTKFADVAFEYLPNFPHLELLTLSGANLNGSGLAFLNQLKSLHHLYLSANKIKEMQHLAGLAELLNLETLDLSRSLVNAEAIQYIQNLPNLHTLTIYGSGIDDAGVQLISKITSLEKLDLSETAVTDSSMRYLLQLTNLKELYLRNNSKITNQAIANLVKHPSLVNIVADGSAVNQEAETYTKMMPQKPRLSYSSPSDEATEDDE